MKNDPVAILLEDNHWLTANEAGKLLAVMAKELSNLLRPRLKGKIPVNVANQLLNTTALSEISNRPLGDIVVSAIAIPSLELINDKKTVIASRFDENGTEDIFFHNRQPPKNFRYPTVGNKVIAKCNYKDTEDGMIPAGTYGEVVANRFPKENDRTDTRIGCYIKFSIKGQTEEHIIPWDCVEDTLAFFYQEIECTEEAIA